MALATSSPNARPPFQSQGFLKPPAQPTSSGSNSSHNVGFASLSLAPSSSLGFGFASSAPMPTTFGSAGMPSSRSPLAGPSTPSPLAAAASKQRPAGSATRRRRREDSSDEEQDEAEEPIPSRHRPIKKMRSPSAALFNSNSASAAPSSPLNNPLGHRSSDDVMRQLGHLDKTDLINVLGSLMDQHPALVPQVQALLPRPSPATFMAQLPALENAVLSCIPAHSRPEYVLSRVKTALEAHVTESRLTLQSLNVATEHASTAFAFLHALTASVQRLERALPPANSALNSLVPVLFNAWHLFLSRISASVNQQGKILGADFVQRMFDDVQLLCTVPPQQGSDSHRFIFGVAERLNKEIGWLASRRSRSSTVEMEEL